MSGLLLHDKNVSLYANSLLETKVNHGFIMDQFQAVCLAHGLHVSFSMRKTTRCGKLPSPIGLGLQKTIMNNERVNPSSQEPTARQHYSLTLLQFPFRHFQV